MTLGRLAFIRDVERPKFAKSTAQHCEYQCACGRKVVILRASVRSGKTRSCGCVQAERWTGLVRVGVAESRSKQR